MSGMNPMAEVLHCVSKMFTHLACYNFDIHKPVLGRRVTGKISNKTMFYFSPHLTSACALPGETGNQKIESFRFNAASSFANRVSR